MTITKRNPIIAIVGKPNVGKSTFFNKLLGEQKSITSEIAGTTRDRVVANVKWLGRVLTFVDTAGLDEPDKNEKITENIQKQVDVALDEADLILFMVDGTGLIENQDLEIADRLRKSPKKILLVVNKVESPKVRDRLGEFYKLGLGEPWGTSSIHGHGVADLLDEIVNYFEKSNIFSLKIEDRNHLFKVALIGRPNTGKSTLLNFLTKSNRAIVSDIPGTTRDAISSKVEWKGKTFVLIDTAGVRRAGKIERGIEKYSVVRTLRSIDESDLVVVMIDGIEGFVRGDVHLITHAFEAGKNVIITINKMDIADPTQVNINKFAFIRKLPFVYISAKTGKSVDVLVERICSYL